MVGCDRYRALVSAPRARPTDEVTGFRAEGVADDEKEECCFANLSVPIPAVKSVCSVTAILDSCDRYRALVSARRARPTDDVTGFRSEDMADDEKEECCLADLSVPMAAVKSVCSVTAILDSRSDISTISESVAAKMQAAVSDVQIVGPMTDG